jgi:glycine/D-amino acid oxidase-like deaminating enzyme/nitrite reductase/ring-hydroxylating ferredoxin subunit
MDTNSYWIDSASLPRFAKLTRDQHVDVVVVGGGITGLTAAYLLTTAGKSVAVIERGRCAGIDTGHTSAHLTMVTDKPLSDLVDEFGRDHAQAAWDAGLAAIARIDSMIRKHRIDCAFAWVEGYRHRSWTDDERGEHDRFAREAAVASDLGFDATFVEEVPGRGGPGVRFDGQARFHPRKYLAGLARAVRDAEGQIYEHTNADGFLEDPLRVKIGGRTLTCEDIVLATHNPLVGVSGMVSATVLQTKLALYTSYVIAGRAPRGTVPDALLWDSSDPYHYLRTEPHRTFDLVIFGGEDHKTGQVESTTACYDRLGRTLASFLPAVQVTHRWSGQVIETPDGLPYIGRTADHQWIATGFAGNGMTFGTLGAMIAADGILGHRNPWTDLFDPERSAIRRGARQYLVENKDYPYYLIRDRFAGAQGRSLRAVKRGRGVVIERAGAKVAAYRDESGAVTLRSATCTHMGCLVGWNDAERTWDCPCHGSRFQPDGSVLSGPAETPLAKVE